MGIGVFFMYTLHRYLKIRLNYPSKRAEKWLLQNVQLIRIQSFVFSLIFLYAFITCWKDFKGIFEVLAVCLVISLTYLLPTKKINLRTIPFLKAFWVSLIWTMLFFYLPLAHNESIFNLKLIAPFLFFYALTIPFDIRDQWLDDQQLKTLPQLVGTKNAIYIGNVTMLFATLGLYLFWMQNLSIFLLFITYVFFTWQKKIYVNEIPLNLTFDGLILLLAILIN